jgi:ribokinase
MSETICVLGALHLDLTVDVDRLPGVGETVIGSSLSVAPGGKGATQAVAAARLGADVDLIGAVGDDSHGSEVRAALAEEGVGLSSVLTCEKVETGVGIRARLTGGDSAGVVGLGANAEMGAAQVAQAAELIAGARVLLAQLELSDEVLLEAFGRARSAETLVLLDATPARPVPKEVLALVDVLLCNRREGAVLVNERPDDVSDSGLVRRLAALGPGRVVLTRGVDGALGFDGERSVESPGLAAEYSDSSAAADAFAGALATALAEGQRFDDALRFSCAAAGLSGDDSSRFPKLPKREQVEERLRG